MKTLEDQVKKFFDLPLSEKEEREVEEVVRELGGTPKPSSKPKEKEA